MNNSHELLMRFRKIHKVFACKACNSSFFQFKVCIHRRRYVDQTKQREHEGQLLFLFEVQIHLMNTHKAEPSARKSNHT